MPADVVLVLGWEQADYESVKSLLPKFGISSFEDLEELQYEDGGWNNFKSEIATAKREVLESNGYELKTVNSKVAWRDEELHIFKDGKFVSEVYDLEGLQYFQEGEYDEEFEDSVLGIPLTSRYRPEFLDVEHPHGQGAMHLNKENLRRIEALRAKVVKILPEFESAYICVKEVWY